MGNKDNMQALVWGLVIIADIDVSLSLYLSASLLLSAVLTLLALIFCTNRGSSNVTCLSTLQLYFKSRFFMLGNLQKVMFDQTGRSLGL